MVETDLPTGSAQTFADQVLRQIPAADGGPLLDNTVTGLGITLAKLLPDEFWDVLEGVWQLAGGPPSLLLVSDDTYVPWELASLQEIRPGRWAWSTRTSPRSSACRCGSAAGSPLRYGRRRIGAHPAQPPATERSVDPLRTRDR